MPTNAAQQSPIRSRASRAGGDLRPTLVAIVTLAALLAVWTRIDAPLFQTGDRPRNRVASLEWAMPGNSPITVTGEAEGAAFLALGDSRVWRGVDLPSLEDAGAGRGALLWYGGADLAVLLQKALERPPGRLLVALSPHSLHPERNRLIEELMRTRPASFEPDATAESVRAWEAAARARLCEQGYPEPQVALATTRVVDDFVARRARRGFSTAVVDRDLALAVDRFRSERVGTVAARHWNRAWTPVLAPAKSNAGYAIRLRAELAPEREAGAARVRALLAQAVQAGWQVACIRLPISAELRAVEDRTVPSQLLADIPGALGLPYRDFGGGTYPSSDGSHLTWGSALAFSRELGQWLTGDLGWGER